MQVQAPPYTLAEAEQFGERLFWEYRQRVGDMRIYREGVRFEPFYDFLIRPKFGVHLVEGMDLGFDDCGRKVLGDYEPISNVARIDKSIDLQSGNPRRTFTLYHEVMGHGVFQGPWLRTQALSSPLVTTEISISDKEETLLERQANRCGVGAAAPLLLVAAFINREIDPGRKIVFRGPAEYCLGRNLRGPCEFFYEFEDMTRAVARRIQKWFDGLSVESLSYRVADCGLLVNASTARSGFRLHRVG